MATDTLDACTHRRVRRAVILEVMGGFRLDCCTQGLPAVLIVSPCPSATIAASWRRFNVGGISGNCLIVVVRALPADSVSYTAPAGAGAGDILTALLRERFAERNDPTEIRCTVLGHIQRGGSPIPFDRVLATQYGVKAVELVADGRWGELVCLRGGEIGSVPIADVASAPREIDPAEPLLKVARSVGIELGA